MTTQVTRESGNDDVNPFATKTETELLCSEVIHGLCYGVERQAGSADPSVRTR